MLPRLTAAVLLVLTATAAPAAGLLDYPQAETFIEQMSRRYGFAPERLRALFARAQVRPEVLDAIRHPAEAKPWYTYRAIFLTAERIAAGAEFCRGQQATLERARKRYGVEPELVCAILGVETFYGRRTGRYRVLESLATLAFDYPPRAAFFRRELEQLLLLAREEGLDPLALRGSYAGAMGMPQFIASSYRSYAVDFDGDRRRDLWRSPADAIASVANYFARHGWRADAPVAVPATVRGDAYRALLADGFEPSRTLAEARRLGIEPQAPLPAETRVGLLELAGTDGPEYWLTLANFHVITRYNRSPLYAMAVYQLSQRIRAAANGR